MRLAPRIVSLAMPLLATGCISYETVVKVKSDGSGTIVETVTMSPQVLETLKQSASEGASPGRPNPLSVPGLDLGALGDPAQAKARAARMGDGVVFVSADPIETPSGKGTRIVFSFGDVTKLKISPRLESPGGRSQPSTASFEPLHFAFQREKGRSVLIVQSTKPATQQKSATPASPPARPTVDPTTLAMVREFMRGMHVRFGLELDGKVLETNATHVDGGAITILDVDFDALLKDEAALRRLMEFRGSSAEEAREALKGLPGIRVNLEPEIRAVFQGK